MTTKLQPSKAPVLYTAAEARRIDIERGGEGFIVNTHTEKHYSYNESLLVWSCEERNSVEGGRAYIEPHWLPLTASLDAEQGEIPEPEQTLYSTPDYGVTIDRNLSMLSIRHQNKTCTRHIENWVALSSGEGERIEQLEKELAIYRDYKGRFYDAMTKFNELNKETCGIREDKSQLEKELAEYKSNYHEILADHGELTRKFDELKEKQRSMRFVLLDAIVASMETDATHRISNSEATVVLKKYEADL